MTKIVLDDEDPTGFSWIKVYDHGELIVSIKVTDAVVGEAIEDAIEPLAQMQKDQIDEFLGGGS